MATGIIAEQSIGQYELEQLVGEDAFADTYLAYDSGASRQVLISVLDSSHAENESYVSRYVSRANALSQIRHPNIATIYDSGVTAEGRPYIVSEQIEGFPLADRLRRLAQQLSPAHAIYALTLVRQIASGLSLAERLGVFHYALTPRHILLRSVTLKTDGSAVLINLDIPPSDQLDLDATDDPQLASYLSPEQLSGKDIDGRSHVYSLGIMLFQLLTGKLPEQDKSNWQLPLRKMSAVGTPLESLREDLAPETYDLVNKSLRLRPGSRYETIAEFVGALDRALAAEDLRIHTSDLVEPRRPRPVYLAPILLLLLCVLLAAAMWLFNPGNSDTQPLAAADDPNSSVLMAGAVTATPTPTAASIVSSATSSNFTETSVAMTVRSSDITASDTASELQPTASLTVTSTPMQKADPTATPSAIPPTANSPTATEIVPTPLPSYVISVSSANLRRGPGTRYEADGFVMQDETVVIIGRAGKNDLWYVVETTDGRVGWISATVGRPAGPTDLKNVLEAATVPAPPPTYTPTPTNTPIPTDTPVPPPSNGNGGNKQPGNKPKATPTPPL